MIPKKTTIALVGDSLGGGGAERVHAVLSVFFESKGIEVHNIIFVDDIVYDYKGVVLNLGKKNTATTFKKLQRLYELRSYFKKHHFDFVLDFRYRVNTINEFLMAHYVYQSSVIYTIHSGILHNYISKRPWIARFIYGKHNFVSVSKALEKALLQQYKIKAQTIYNPFEVEKIQELAQVRMPMDDTYIIAVGRMNEKVKQFDVLIEAYSKTVLPQNGIKLKIIGSGVYLEDLKRLVAEKKLGDLVEFLGYQKNPFCYQKNALFTVVTSEYEGLSNVIVESLLVGTPAISYDCFAGPSEIITDRFNGLLVENQNKEQLVEAIDLLYTDAELRVFCKANSVPSALRFSVEKIGNEWLDYLNTKS